MDDVELGIVDVLDSGLVTTVVLGIVDVLVSALGLIVAFGISFVELCVELLFRIGVDEGRYVSVTHVRFEIEMLKSEYEVKITFIVSNLLQALEREFVRFAYAV